MTATERVKAALLEEYQRKAGMLTEQAWGAREEPRRAFALVAHAHDYLRAAGKLLARMEGEEPDPDHAEERELAERKVA